MVEKGRQTTRFEAQNEAVLMRGFNDDHVGILANPDLHRYINDVLQRPDLRNITQHRRATPQVSHSAERQ